MVENVCVTCGEPFPEGELTCPNDGTSVQVEKTQRRDPMIGARIGEYVIEEQIGRGGMGIVYRGIQPQISKQVAVKMLRPDIAADPDQVQRLLTEAQAVNAIRHRSIIDIFGFGELPDGRHYVVMEFLDGQPLDIVMRNEGAMPALEVLPILDEILSALSAAHGRGVIHRDLKPSNVFVATQPDGSRYLKLLDFGLAKRAGPDDLSDQTNPQRVTGTPDFMAPEQARGEPVGPQTDLYALGVLAFQMLTGRLPFVAPTPVEVLHLHVEAQPPRPSSLVAGIPRDLEALVLRLLEKEMSARPSSAATARAECKRIARALKRDKSSSVAARPEWRVSGERRKFVDPAAPTRRLIRPQTWVGIAATAVALITAAVVVFDVLQRREPPPTVVVSPPPELPVERVEPVPTPLPEATPEVAPEVAPAEPRPGVPNAPAVAKWKKAPASAAALTDRVARLEQALRKRTRPGEEPDGTALALLARKRLELTTGPTGRQLADIGTFLDQWERQFLH